MSWGAIVEATQVTVDEDAIADIDYWFDEVVTLNPGELAVCEATYTAPAAHTDDCNVVVQCTLDDSSEDWDDESYQEFQIEAVSSTAVKVTFLMSGVYKFRVGMYMSGSTDTTGTGDFRYRKDGVSA